MPPGLDHGSEKASETPVDREPGHDLEAATPYKDHVASTVKGDVDGYHSGFPSGNFSRLRWRKQPGLPGPVRSRAHRYGFPDDNKKQQAEADMGTILMSRC